MNISEEHKAIFIHIHKSAGGSVGTLLKEVGFASNVHNDRAIPNHITASDLLYKHEDLSDYRFFTIVRNPWARLVSNYHWVRGFKEQPPHAKAYKWFRTFTSRRLNEHDDFEAYVRNLYSTYQEVHPLHKISEIGKQSPSVYENAGAQVYPGQIDYTCDAKGREIVKCWGRVESINKDIRAICENLGFDTIPELPHVHKSSSVSKDYRSFYTSNELTEMVGEMYAEDAQLYGYDFDGVTRDAQTNF